MTVDDQLRNLLRERAVPPAAPAGRVEAVLSAGRARRRRRVATTGAAAALAVATAITVPFGLSTRDAVPAAAAPLYPPGASPVPVTEVVVSGQEIVFTRVVGVCTSVRAAGAARLEDGRWRLAVWTIRPATARTPTRQPCVAMARSETVRVTLPEAYAGQPVVDASSGREVPVNGGHGFPVPSYLPPGYSLAPGPKGGVTLSGPQGSIEVIVGGRDLGTIRDLPGWPYDVLDRPDIDGAPGVLIRYRNDSGDTLLRWVAGERGFRLQIMSDRLEPQELVRIARSMS